MLKEKRLHLDREMLGSMDGLEAMNELRYLYLQSV